METFTVPTPRSMDAESLGPITFGPIDAEHVTRPTMKRLSVITVLGVLSLSSLALRADTLNVLGVADNFSVLGATTVTNTGSTVLAGDLGLSPGSSITGFPPGVVGGSTHISDTMANTAQLNAAAAYTTLRALPPTVSGLSGYSTATLSPGVYNFSSTAELTGPLTLDFGGLSGRSFVFNVGSALNAEIGSSVLLINQGTNDSVYWTVGSSATLFNSVAFEGSIIALTSITLDNSATIGCGSAIALNAAVTLDTNTIGGGCKAGNVTGQPGITSITPTPEPTSLALMATGLLGGAGLMRRKSRMHAIAA